MDIKVWKQPKIKANKCLEINLSHDAKYFDDLLISLTMAENYNA